MSALTGLLYGALIVYLGGWYIGSWSGNFSLLLFILTVVTFGYWLAERLHFMPGRVAAAGVLESQDARRRAELQRHSGPVLAEHLVASRHAAARRLDHRDAV